MDKAIQFDLDTMDHREVHSLLLSSVAPRPIAFASTVDAEGNVNLSPFSFFNVFSSNPPIAIFSPSRGGRDNKPKHSYLNVKEVPEAAISIVNHAMVEKMSLSSSNYARGINEFEKAGFTEFPSTRIKPPMVKESPISFECKVNQVIELGDHGGAGNLIICEVLVAHVHESCLGSDGKIDPTKVDQVGRMGGNWYSRTNENAMFEIPKPGSQLGIGVDALPKSVRESHILTANNIGRIGGLPELPSKSQIDERREEQSVSLLFEEFTDNKNALKDQLQYLARTLINEGKTSGALEILLIADDL